jgi:predicted nucleic acid-binding protein
VLAVDTNVLVYAADADSQFHTACRDWLERQRAGATGRLVHYLGDPL